MQIVINENIKKTYLNVYTMPYIHTQEKDLDIVKHS